MYTYLLSEDAMTLGQAPFMDTALTSCSDFGPTDIPPKQSIFVNNFLNTFLDSMTDGDVMGTRNSMQRFQTNLLASHLGNLTTFNPLASTRPGDILATDMGGMRATSGRLGHSSMRKGLVHGGMGTASKKGVARPHELLSTSPAGIIRAMSVRGTRAQGDAGHVAGAGLGTGLETTDLAGVLLG